jgi:DNA gyrase/topoisomerase IV subunit B
MDRYTADEIEVLPGFQGIRKRPQIYVGDLASASSVLDDEGSASRPMGHLQLVK